MSDDEKILSALGYKQELRRELSSFSNFAVSFTIISILTGLNGLFGLTTGGPAVIIWGWFLVAVMSTMVAMSMAEICSAYPTSGGLYYFAAQLSPSPESAALIRYNLVGQVAVTAGISYACAALFATMISLLNPSFVPVPWQILLLYLGVLVLQGLINTFGVKLIKILNDISVWWHILGTGVIIISVLALASTNGKLQPASFVFTDFYNLSGFDSPVYVFFIGLLTAQFTFTGYDASAHMTEETKNAAVAGPVGIVMSVVISFVVGWAYLMGLLFSVQNFEEVVAGFQDGDVFVPAGIPTIFYRAGGRAAAVGLIFVVVGAMFLCGLSSLLANSRMLYAFARDGAIPGSNFWHKINPSTQSPTNTIWLGAGLAFILGLPTLGSSVAFAAITSIATIGLYISYVIPTALRHTIGKDKFKPGPWNLGKWSPIVGWISILWVALITVLFCLPAVNPVQVNNFNYASIMVVGVFIIIMAWWVVDARRWFKGPKIAREVNAAEEAMLETEVDADHVEKP
ncbi:amino acid transporter [Cladochytrium replicatum]|nr:amino acid transporter [Cladochytrium replicatum]